MMKKLMTKLRLGFRKRLASDKEGQGLSLIVFLLNATTVPTLCALEQGQHMYDVLQATCAVLSCVQLFVAPWTIAHLAPLSMRILQARILEWVVMPSFRESFQTRDQAQVSHTSGGFFTI